MKMTMYYVARTSSGRDLKPLETAVYIAGPFSGYSQALEEKSKMFVTENYDVVEQTIEVDF